MLWPYTRELFAGDPVDAAAVADGIGVAPGALEARWRREVAAILEEATLCIPEDTPFLSLGRRGRHSEHLGHLLAEMQVLQRTHPDATW
jgi:ring-1,2-phenylacetyl-CoA epoxidase subunit PaaC